MSRCARPSLGIVLVLALSACNAARPPENRICDTTTPGAFGVPTPTSCHDIDPKGQRGSSAGSQVKGEAGASTPRQRP